ncbi:hypothetical protein BCR35DRAFT_308441 [Leucosporidium creatinivorum]|uniref:F-box domain-containing protein n=1 Tax=Leucosporidium creatinivorum TaxID=106004 RepID=A0A1Y2E5G2_9BASI|nr:hypothetical protein BCR35DRAFT_308441 [Leucosporidium creatinivorum]
MEATPLLQQPTAHGKRSGAARRKLKKERQALLDAQFANLEIDPEKPPRLLEELMYHIIDLGAETGSLATHKDWQRARSFLSRASLVCSGWHQHSRRALLKDVALTSDKQLEKFLLFCRGEQTVCDNLSVVSQRDESLDGALVAAVLGQCFGMKRLSVKGVRVLEASALCGAGLADLKTLIQPLSLIINHSGPLAPDSFKLPFTLDHLQVNGWGPHGALSPLALIATILSNPTKSTTLTFRGGERPKQSIPIAFPDTPCFLTKLEILGDGSFITLLLGARYFFHFLSTCQHLQHFTTNILSEDLLLSIPSPLRELHLWNVDETGGAPIRFPSLLAWFMNIPLTPVNELEKVELTSREKLPAEALVELESACAKQGAQLILTVWDEQA